MREGGQIDCKLDRFARSWQHGFNYSGEIDAVDFNYLLDLNNKLNLLVMQCGGVYYCVWDIWYGS